ncbi:hypothetical protein F2P81_019326 [Scophthalmus maximus]|uniref:GST C-terminal domain-containing protein n=1 Tax=Scophthalmus maximus TaxID=52904 RepID=A0A6A4S6T1_SCOMX|nr:hypothetical protein F2P81_019326 [Scophthalmus maximus]
MRVTSIFSKSQQECEQAFFPKMYISLSIISHTEEKVAQTESGSWKKKEKSVSVTVQCCAEKIKWEDRETKLGLGSSKESKRRDQGDETGESRRSDNRDADRTSSPVIPVPVLQNNNGAPLVGLVTIARHLVKEAKRTELLGDSAESRAVVHQWLEYRVTRLNGCTKDDIKTILKELNLYLQDKSYLAENQLTLADILMYYGIQPLIWLILFLSVSPTQVDLAVQEKEQYVNVTRWFDHMQHYPGVRRHLPPVVVLRNRIYTGRHH